MNARVARTVLAGGLLAGTLDITAAVVFYGLRGAAPIRILQSVASGLLGAAAYRGGPKTAVLGLALHFFIATVACAVYYAASRKLDVLLRWPLISGPLYGIAVYLFMNLVVLPLSAVARRPFAVDVWMVAIHMLFVGLPIALVVSRQFHSRHSPS